MNDGATVPLTVGVKKLFTKLPLPATTRDRVLVMVPAELPPFPLEAKVWSSLALIALAFSGLAVLPSELELTSWIQAVKVVTAMSGGRVTTETAWIGPEAQRAKIPINTIGKPDLFILDPPKVERDRMVEKTAADSR